MPVWRNRRWIPDYASAKISNKPAENTLSLHAHAHPAPPLVWNSLCSVRLISTASHWWALIQWPQWLDESRPGCMPWGISWISESLLLSLYGTEAPAFERAWFLAVVLIWFDLRAPCSNHKVKTQTWILSLHALSKQATSEYLIQLRLYWCIGCYLN